MKKVLLEEFIKKYSLGGSIDSVNWRVDGGKLTVTGTPSDTQVICFVSTKAIGLPDGVYSIYDTSQLKAFLGVLGDDINVEVVTADHNNQPISFKLNDKPSGGRTKVQFVLSDPAVIPKESSEADLTPFDMTIKFDSNFMTQFIKAKGSLADLPVFAVVNEDGKTSFVLGYDSDMLTSQVDLQVEAEGSLKEVLNFSADYLKDIFMANKEASAGEIGISNRGVMFVTFANDVFNPRYYLLKINKQKI